MSFETIARGATLASVLKRRGLVLPEDVLAVAKQAVKAGWYVGAEYERGTSRLRLRFNHRGPNDFNRLGVVGSHDPEGAIVRQLEAIKADALLAGRPRDWLYEAWQDDGSRSPAVFGYEALDQAVVFGLPFDAAIALEEWLAAGGTLLFSERRTGSGMGGHLLRGILQVPVPSIASDDWQRPFPVGVFESDRWMKEAPEMFQRVLLKV